MMKRHAYISYRKKAHWIYPAVAVIVAGLLLGMASSTGVEHADVERQFLYLLVLFSPNRDSIAVKCL
jgi:hypothetical protein